MKVLITGATGFIGSHLTEQLYKKGYDIRVFCRSTSNLKYINHLPIEYVYGDFMDLNSLEAAVKDVDYIYHVAGVVAAKNRKEFFDGNQVSTRNMLSAVIKHNINIKKFIHVSSLAAIGPALDSKHPVDSNTKPPPITTYGESKLAAEVEVLNVMNLIPCTIVRPPAVYGERDIGVLSFFQTMKKSGFAPIIGFGKKLISLVHQDDLVRGIILAGESHNTNGKSYFISSNKFYTWEEIGEVTAKVLGRKRARYIHAPHAVVYVAAAISDFIGRFQKKPPIFDFEKGKDITQPFWICSVIDSKNDFGYEQQITVEEGVERTINWYTKEGWL